MSTAIVPGVTNGSALPEVARVVVFDPRPRDWKYLEALREILGDDGKPTLEKLATKLGITHQAVSKLRRRPGFEAWLSEQLRAGRADRFEQLYERNWSLAMRGSIDHSNWCAKIEGRFQQSDSAPVGAVPVQVNILVPRPQV